MNDKMLAYQLHGPHDLRLAEVPVPEKGPEQVLLKTTTVGICGSDIHYFEEGRCGTFAPRRPFSLGHEFTAIVSAAGEKVVGLSVGDRVVVDPLHTCSKCRDCRSGRYNLCAYKSFIGSAASVPHHDGAHGQYVIADGRNCYPLPDSIDDLEGALLEPLSVALHAMLRAGQIAGRSVLVMGGGPIGQLILMAARTLGAGSTTICDPLSDARQFALAHGTDNEMDPAGDQWRDAAAGIQSEGWDIILEASGAGPALANALHLARRGGTIVQVGTLPAEVALPANLIMPKELTVTGSVYSANVFPVAIELMATGRVNVKPLISKTLSFDQLPEAMLLAGRKKDIMKVVVTS